MCKNQEVILIENNAFINAAMSKVKIREIKITLCKNKNKNWEALISVVFEPANRTEQVFKLTVNQWT